MHISLDSIATVAGLLLMFGGLVGAWVETRLKVKQLMRDSAIATERYRECRKVQFEKHDAIIEGLAALKQKCAEDTGELKTSIARNEQKLDDLAELVKRTLNGRKRNG